MYNKNKQFRHRLFHTPKKRVEYLSEPDTPEKTEEEKKRGREEGNGEEGGRGI